MSAILEVRGVSRFFGGLRALHEMSVSLDAGEIVGLIGPNGAGKTTLVNLVTGVYRPSAGEILFGGRRIDGKKPYQVSRLGIARTFQVVQPFPRMTVCDNVAAGALFAGHAPSLRDAREAALEHLAFVGLAREAGALAATLTLASRKRLELAKSLAMRPKVLLLDEVNAGLNPAEIEQALGLIRALAARGLTILIIEHLMKVVTAVCSRIVVLHHGEKLAEGAPADVVRDPAVVDAYLGSRWSSRSEGNPS